MNEECPDDNDLVAYIDENVSPDERAYLEEHLAGCATCREMVVFAFSVDPTITHRFGKPSNT